MHESMTFIVICCLYKNEAYKKKKKNETCTHNHAMCSMTFKACIFQERLPGLLLHSAQQISQYPTSFLLRLP